MIFCKMNRDDQYPSVWYNDRVDHFDTVICPRHPEHRRAPRNDRALSIEIKKNKLGDFVPTVYGDWLITDTLAYIFKKNNLTGYKLRPVDVCNRELPFKLWELMVVGKGGDAHPDSGITLAYHCEHCGRKKYYAFKNSTGIIVDENNWDGSDFFTVTAYPKYVFVTEKVKGIIEKNRLKGVVLIPSTELRREEGGIDDFVAPC
jgi:hypothetical protein